jgi:CPA1 family monovalent cation:H+ antiporter
MSTFDVASILFLFAAATGLANERLFRLPHSIALLLASLLVSLAVVAFGHLAPVSWLLQGSQHRIERADLPRALLDGVLALLLFAASWHVDLKGLRRQRRLIFALATVGVIVASSVFAFGFWLVTGLLGTPIPLAWCFLLGAILAPTDAVAVDGLLQRIVLPAGLRDIIAGESLFNDGTAVVVFLAAVALVSGESEVIGHGRLLAALVVECTGGAAIGVIAGYLARLVIERSRDEIVGLTVSIALALSTYRLAILVEVSGPIAVVVAGLVLVNASPKGQERSAWRQRLATFWSLIDDLVNTLLFLLMGAEIFTLDLAAFVQVAVLAAIPLAILSRLVSIALPVALWPVGGSEKARMIGALTWVGLRGAMSIALVLTIPAGPYEPTLAAACYAVVIFTIVVQGLSTPAILGVLYKAKQADVEAAESATGHQDTTSAEHP